uniref:Uncharacterized protein n=1 Tax=Amphimedon queenslandica TaxID=400682 RepID=A0A1X7STQ9_AMPQE
MDTKTTKFLFENERSYSIVLRQINFLMNTKTTKSCLKDVLNSCSVGQQCSAASMWHCLGSLVVTTASDAKSTTYKKNITRLY